MPFEYLQPDETCDCIAASEGPPSDIVHVADDSVKDRVKVIHEVSPATPATVRVQTSIGTNLFSPLHRGFSS